MSRKLTPKGELRKRLKQAKANLAAYQSQLEIHGGTVKSTVETDAWLRDRCEEIDAIKRQIKSC